MDIEREFIHLLSKEIESTLDKVIKHARFCKEHNLEWEDITITWIDKNSSPFPNQDRKWLNLTIYKNNQLTF